MLSYQHAYHAGGPADVHKHALLAALLAHLTRSGRPLTYVETHAGRGLYDLGSPEARKTRVAARGIEALMARRGLPPRHPYRRAIMITRSDHGYRTYPGSPLIARLILRHRDRLQLFELHPQEHAALVQNLAAANVTIARRDGFDGLRALAPLSPRPGLVLIDPSYERDEEFEQVAAFVPELHRLWPEAVVMVWYPVLPHGLHAGLCRRLAGDGGLPRQRRSEVEHAGTQVRRGLLGSGVLLINSPRDFAIPEPLVPAPAPVEPAAPPA